MPPKSVFRQPGAKHFQLVHRSQRDPLIHDPEASKHVLKAVERGNVKKGKSRADLEAAISPEDLDHDSRLNVGEAALYGVYFDDTEYDYMQHLRAVGMEEDGVDSILIEAPAASKNTSKAKGKERQPISLKDIPSEALPSSSELPRNFESQEAIPSSIAGFQPDMDPHLRQVLEALEDDAFVDDSIEDDFFAELVGDGERDETERLDFEFFGDEEFEENELAEDEDTPNDDNWEARFAKFKKNRSDVLPSSDSDEEHSEGADTVGNLPKLPVIGGKRRRKGTSDASGYSMSSSSMYRTEALLTLDERFDQMMEKEYDGEGEDTEEAKEEDVTSSDNSDEAPDLITSREDFEAMMDDFLDNYEILGRKLKAVLPGDTGAEKLETLRRTMGQDERVRIAAGDSDEDTDDEKLFAAYHAADENKKDRWDCETILSTYSNLENHPRLIRVRDSRPVPKIKLDPRTGLPSVDGDTSSNPKLLKDRRIMHDLAEEQEDATATTPKQTITRSRDETKEDKKLRKHAVKAERQARRIDKKVMKEQFSTEMKLVAQGLSNKAKSSRTRKL
ncbi:Low temperature viability protein-domain-containing protein [Hygrophoropsis aurantiaca]|uniref:Low temperature viability protein-domain-containing protein n=1 Tax=Hygrophoropsis aurantiaca TaxID=72124 RepID=A0ACB8A0J5_9AGAM|nr:Low temperature viability protein-domain-containing protein [Hygrophoropsis aurantiaca]